jgi:hypothetical protein
MLGVCEEDNWEKLPAPYTYFLIDCYPLSEGFVKGNRGIYCGFPALNNREIFVSRPVIMHTFKVDMKNGEFNKSYWKLMTQTLYDKHFKFKSVLERTFKVVNDEIYCEKYDIPYVCSKEPPAALIPKVL